MELEPKETNMVNIVFEDIAGHFAQKEIEALIDAGIIIKEEYSAKYFPDEPITRIEMIKMLVRAIGKEEHNMDCACNTGFTDEDDLTEEEREYICAGKHYNIISGYPDGTIRPDGEATRGEAFEILDKHDEIKEIIEQEEATDKIEEDLVDSPKSTNGWTLRIFWFAGQQANSQCRKIVPLQPSYMIQEKIRCNSAVNCAS
jgi:hypothetical protein